MGSSLEVGVLAGPQKLTQRICDAIEASGWRVRRISNADLADREAALWDVTLLVADSVVREVFNELVQAASVPGVPVIVVGSVSDPQVIADMLRTGADDYLAHPFASEELVARIQNLAHRYLGQQDLSGSDCINLDPSSRSITRGRYRVVLPPREWALLQSLLEHDEGCVSLESLAQTDGLEGLTDSAIVSTVSRLRRRLTANGLDGLAIRTVRRCGYRLHRLDIRDCTEMSEPAEAKTSQPVQPAAEHVGMTATAHSW